MAMRDRETGSLWPTHEGVALDGPLRSAILPRLTAYQCLLWEWVEEHPDSLVLAPPPHPAHKDLRHGHGSWFYIGSPGLPLHPIHSLENETLDPRLPEHELVLGINDARGVLAIPLAELHKRGCVIERDFGGDPIVAWCRHPSSYWVAAFERRIGDRVFDFEYDGGHFRDRQTGSFWNVEGRAFSGPLAGENLRPLESTFLKWHVWAPYHPETEIEGSDSAGVIVAPGAFAELIEHLRRSGFETKPEQEVLQIWLPPRARRGLRARIEGEPFLLFLFDSSGAARDYAESKLRVPKDLLRSFFATDPPSDIPRRALAAGAVVIESDPDVQYAGETSMDRLPEEQIAWAKLLSNAAFTGAVATFCREPVPEKEPTFTRLFESLRASGDTVERVKPMVLHWLPAAAISGFTATISGDDFLIYQFAAATEAEAYQQRQEHTIRSGVFVLRSNPPGQYKVPSEEALDQRPEDVSWSALLGDPRFAETLSTLAARWNRE